MFVYNRYLQLQFLSANLAFFENSIFFIACSRSFPGFVGSGLVHETCQRIRRLVFNVPQ